MHDLGVVSENSVELATSVRLSFSDCLESIIIGFTTFSSITTLSTFGNTVVIFEIEKVSSSLFALSICPLLKFTSSELS